MKLKTLSLLAGVAAVSISAVPFMANANANAQSDLNSPVKIAQAENNGNPRKLRKFEALGLSDTQKSQIQAIMQQARTEMKDVLTPEQIQELEAAKQNGRKKEAWRNLNLTESQRNQVRQIRSSKKDQIKAVLTPEQLEKWEEMKQNRRSRRQSRNR